MKRPTSWPVLLLALMMVIPGLPSAAEPATVSTFSGGASSVRVAVSPRPAENATLGIALPWNADVLSASFNVRGEGIPDTISQDHPAASLAAGDTGNLTLDSGVLRLNRSSWSWGQNQSTLGTGCQLSGTVLDGGLRLEASNPQLSASGGGIWRRRVALDVTETGGLARVNESITAHIAFPDSTVRDPQKDVRVCNSTFSEVPSGTANASFLGGWCTGTDVIFAAPSIAPYSKQTFYIYYGNPSAGAPSYKDRVYFADGFSQQALSPAWTVANPGGIQWRTQGELRVNGTASCTTSLWQGLSLACSPPLGEDNISLQATINASDGASTGYLALVSLVQDSQNFISMGVMYDSTDFRYTPAKYVLVTGQGVMVSLVASADAVEGVAHVFRMDLSQGTVSAYVDGTLLGFGPAVLEASSIRIAAAPRAAGDSLNATFDGVAAFCGYSTVGVLDPPPVQTMGAEEDSGFAPRGTIVSPLIENPSRLPLGIVRLRAVTPPGTSVNLSVLGPDNATLAFGLGNADVVNVTAEPYPAIRLCATLSTSDGGTSPRLLEWGVGATWNAVLDDVASASNLTVSGGQVGLALSPQRWTRLPSPALNPGIASTFDDTGVARPCVLFSEGVYMMYYAGYDGVRWRIGLAVSPDGQAWTRHPESPVLVPGTVGAWDGSHVDWPMVVHNGTGYQMWYAGSGDGGASYSIGYASSGDGVHWTKSQGAILSKGATGAWNSAGVFAPRVILDGQLYRMWYAGRNATAVSIGAATSADGINWTEWPSNPAVGPQPGWSSAAVLPGTVETGPGGTWSLWFSGYNSTVSGVGYASSPDGENWTVAPLPVLANLTGGASERLGTGNISVMFGGPGMMWYTAFNGTRWRICAAAAGPYPSGDVLSGPVDLGSASASLSISATAAVPANCSIDVSARSSPDGSAWGAWTALNGSLRPVQPQRYVQWKAHLAGTNDSSPTLTGITGISEHYCLRGHAVLPPIVLSANRDIGTVRATVTATGPGTAEAQASVDGGASWKAVGAGLAVNMTGGTLDLRVVLGGDYGSTPSLSSVSVSADMSEHPSDVELDVGDDGTIEWNATGRLGTGAVPVGDISAALDAYLEVHRNDAGNMRTVPLAISSASRGVVTAGGLDARYDTRVFANNPPVIRSTPPDRAQVGLTFVYHVDARDPDLKDVLSYALPAAPEGMTVSPYGDLSWLPTEMQVGYCDVSLEVSDGRDSARQDFTLVVSNGPLNLPPRVASVPPKTATAGHEYLYSVCATDPNSDALHYALAIPRPDGASMDASAGILSWVPSIAQAGANAFDVLVSDGKDTVHHRFVVNVSLVGTNSIPTVVSSPPSVARVNTSCRYQVVATDTDGDTLSFSLVSGPAGAAVSPQGEFEWWPRAVVPASVTVVIRISDGNGYTVHSFNLSVLPENRPPAFQGEPSILTVTGGHLWTYTPLVVDPDGERNFTFNLVTYPAGMTVDRSSGRLSWRPGVSTSGQYEVVLNVSDGISSTPQEFTITVKAGAAPQQGPGWIPFVAVAAIGAGAAAAAAWAIRRRRAEQAPENEAEQAEEPAGPAAAPESYEKEEAGAEGAELPSPVAALPPPETMPGSAEAQPMKPVASAPAAEGAIPGETARAPPAHEEQPAPAAPGPSPIPAIVADSPVTEASAPSPAPAAPAPSAPASTPPPWPAVEDIGPPLPAPPLTPAVTIVMPLPEPAEMSTGHSKPVLVEPPSPAPPAEAPAPERLPTASPAPQPVGPSMPRTGPAAPSKGDKSFDDDMDFLRSYLSGAKTAEAPRPAVGNMEWQQIKDYALGLKGPAEPLQRPQARPPAPAQKEEPVPPAERRKAEPVPPAERRKEEPGSAGPKDEKPAAKAFPSLDDILKELDG